MGSDHSQARVCLAAVALIAWLCAAANLSLAQAHPQAVSRSPHGNLNIPCQNCHTSVGWKPIRAVPEFDHDKTNFPLRGMHAGVACTQCHAKPVFSNTGTSCGDCHANIHRGKMRACEQCHTAKGWNVTLQLANNHENRFPLIGGHAGLDCADCHKSAATSQFEGLDTRCYSCHQTTYVQTNAPNHVALGIPQTCQECHTTAAWSPATFNHNALGFPLTGAHANLQCDQCHKGNYKLQVDTCVSCHLADYKATTNPNHQASGLPQQCEVCHSTTAWSPASFNHNATGWPLTGAHATLLCSQCHGTSNYSLSNTACVACHQSDYMGTTNPNHQSAGFPRQCDVCHNTTAWSPATFNHNNTSFPLTGAHTTVPCASCHVQNNYTSLPTDCYGCHKADYTGTTNPNHVSAGFPTTCATCHTTTNWLGATFNHTWFNMNHGGANGVCATCHTNSNDYTVFQCTNCHTKANTDNRHEGVGGYVYNSVNCYACHRGV